MKRILGLVLACGATSSLAAGALASVPLTHSKTKAEPIKPSGRLAIHQKPSIRRLIQHRPTMAQLAPADEYFGPLGQSIVGINNTMRDTGRRYDVNHDIGPQTFKSVELTERAIRAWAKKYPHDDQLPHAIYLLQRLYTKVLFLPSRDRAHVIAQWLFADFGASPQARQMKKTLALEHLAPIPTPLPVAATSPYTSAFGKAYPSEFAAPAPLPQQKLPVPPRVPSPSPTPLVAPTLSPSPFPATPAPASSPSPSSASTPSPSPTPLR